MVREGKLTPELQGLWAAKAAQQKALQQLCGAAAAGDLQAIRVGEGAGAAQNSGLGPGGPVLGGSCGENPETCGELKRCWPPGLCPADSSRTQPPEGCQAHQSCAHWARRPRCAGGGAREPGGAGGGRV